MAGDRYISVPEGEIATLRSQLANARAEIERLNASRDGYAKDAVARAEENDRIRAEIEAAEVRAAALEAQNRALRNALREMDCPRPSNFRPDDFTVGQCVDAGECGCIAHVAAAAEDISEHHGSTIRDKTIRECADHLSQIAQAMWERCETRRPENPWEVGQGEKEDAVTAWCFDKASEAILSLAASRQREGE